MGRYALADNKDRFFGAIVYLLALADVVALGLGLATIIPALSPVFDFLSILLIPVMIIYGIIPGGFGGIVIFFILILAVVQNQKISYFIRFNTMQSILIGIAISLIQIVFGTLGGLNIIGMVVFLVVMPACIYCMVQCALGKYPEIPSFSKFVYEQVR
ncbi:hypothetical protein I4641_19215 [Waterburya agarophytonicola K14]|uniref:Chloroplast import component protein (Tic20) n=1 Tax=Waterburya agarophytonicola KI4 TaxID=2874699 RepID=A0A964BWM7_9CYAN|nr:Tic20 family protein [Waterburya agarophytonicola]MCC0179102.1 hypothetical protein [Waterburya agarophytonicola KI4]